MNTKAHGTSWARLATLAFTALYVLGFGALFFVRRNEEFLTYVVVVVAVLAIFIFLDVWLGLPDYVLALTSLAGLLHMAGGSVRVDGDVLYAYHLVTIIQGADAGLYILRYDQVVHALGFGVATLVLWYVLRRHAPGLPLPARAFFAVAGGMGLGALNEVIEFVASVTFPHTGVGDYDNNSLDLVFNMLGAMAATAIAWSVTVLKARR